jgi:hypothetical protein
MGMAEGHAEPVATQKVLDRAGMRATLTLSERGGGWNVRVDVPQVLQGGIEHRRYWDFNVEDHDRAVERANSFLEQVAAFKERAEQIRNELAQAVTFQGADRW